MEKQCSLIDYTAIDAYKMTQLLAYVDENKHQLQHIPTSGMLLHTCHWVDYFLAEPTHNLFQDILEGYYPTICKNQTVSQCLVEIACDIRSKIFEEKYIFYQVKKSIDASSFIHPLKKEAQNAMELSRDLREEHAFYAPIDYEHIVSRYMAKYFDIKEESKRLLIIGEGILAQSIASYSAKKGLSKILLVSRTVKEINKKVHDDNVSICTLNNIPKYFTPHPFYCLIATTNIDKIYKEKIFNIINTPQCLSIIDLSSLPTFQKEEIKNKNYLTLYHDVCEKYVNENNIFIQECLNKIQKDIVSYCQKYFQ